MLSRLLETHKDKPAEIIEIKQTTGELRDYMCQVQADSNRQRAALLIILDRLASSGVPLHTRLPLACGSAVRSLEAADFQRMHVDAAKIASFEASAWWD